MADIQSNIDIRIDTSNALASIKLLQAQMSAFHTSMAKGTAAQAAASSQLQQKLIDSVNATQKFSAGIQTIKTTTESFTNSLEKNKLSLGQYFKYSIASTKSFGGMFKTEMSTIDKVARERVKDLQTQYVQLGRDATGAMKAIAIRPLVLDLDNLQTKTAIAAQKQQILNQLLKQGSTNLLNFGKNTQWAGRQLMVGFTIPLAMAGTAAAKAYTDIEKASIQISRVYGDLNTTAEETKNMVTQIKALAGEFTKYGIAIADTMSMAAKAAAMGKTGIDLLQQVNEASKLSALGGVDQDMALTTTISLTNAFGLATDKLASKINFLNAVENQTVTSIEDLTIAIPKAGPVIQQLGGDVEELAFFLTAMREGGINASEGANALKSGLASLINPTRAASDFLAKFGVNVKDIVENNRGDLKKTVMEFGAALDTLNPLDRARAIEQMFGKFQFARISTLLQNVNKEGSQAAKALQLANMSSIQLAAMSRRELDKLESSPVYKFQKSIADLQLSIAPIGETFLKAVTPVIDSVSNFLDGFNKMGDGFKQFVVVGTALLGGLAPVLLMVVGLVANGAANIIKLFANVKSFLNRTATESQILGETTSYLTTEQIKAEAVAASLDQTHTKLKQTFTSETSAIAGLLDAYRKINIEMAKYNVPVIPTSIVPRAGKKMAMGGVVSGPGTATSDSVPANLSNGEVVLSVDTVNKNPAVVGALLSGKKINVPGYATQGIVGSRPLGRGKSRISPNASELSHFNDSSFSSTMTGAAILETAAARGEAYLASWTARLTSQAEKLGIAFEQILEKEFKVFNNKVISMSASLNNLLKPSSGGTTAGIVQKEFALRGEETYGYTALQLKELGTSDEEIKKIIGDLNTTVQAELGNLAADTKMTEADLSKIIDEAYRKVAASNEKLKLAYKEMGEIAYIDSLEGKGSRSGGTRLKGTPAGGLNYRGSNEAALAAGAALRPDQTPTFAPVSKRYYQYEVHLEIYDKLIQSSSQDLQRINGIQDRIAAELELELLAIQKGITTQKDLDAAKQRQLAAVSSSTSVTQTSSVTAGANALAQGVEDAGQMASPSKRLYKAGGDLFLGLHGGLMSSLPKMKVAGQAFGLAASKAYVITPAMQQYLRENARKLLGPYVDAHNAAIPVVNAHTQAEKANTAATQADTAATTANTAIENTSGSVPPKTTNVGFGKVATLGIAASMAASALSMIPGPVGEFTGSLMPAIGIISVVTSLISMLGVSVTAGTVAIAGLSIPLLPLIAGMVALGAAITAFVIINNEATAAKKRELAQINASSKSLASLSKNAEAYGNLLGVSSKPGAATTAAIMQVGGKGKQIDDIATLLQSSDFTNKESEIYKDIQDIKAMSDRQAAARISAQGQMLLGQGAKEKDVDSLMKALQIAAGKRSLKLSFKSIDLTNPQNLKNFEDSLTAFDEEIQKNKDYEKQMTYRTSYGGVTGKGTVVDDVKKEKFNLAIKAKADAAKISLTALNDQFASGVLKQKQYDNAMAKLVASTKNLDEVSQKAYFNKMFKGQDKEIKMIADSMTDAADKTLLYNAVTVMGAPAVTEALSKVPPFIDKIADAELRAIALRRFNQNALKLEFETYMKDMQAFLDGVKTDSAGGGTSPLDEARNILKTLLDANKTNKVTMRLIKDGYSATFAEALGAMDEKIRKQFINTSGVLTKLGRDYKKAFDVSPILTFQTAQNKLIAANKQEKTSRDFLIAQGYTYADVTKLMADADVKAAIAATLADKKIRNKAAAVAEIVSLYNQALSSQQSYDPNKADQDIIDRAQKQIDVLNAQSNSYQDALSILQKQEQDINDKYEQRIDALDKIQSANEKISDQQKGQLDLADALSRGDIAAAAKSAQDIRAKAQQDAFSSQKKALEDAKQAQVNALTVVVKGQTMTMKQLTDKLSELELAMTRIRMESINPAQESIANRNASAGMNSSGTQITIPSSGRQAVTYDPTRGYFVPVSEARVNTGVSWVDPLTGEKYSSETGNALSKQYGVAASKKKAEGGYISGPGSATSDSIPAMLSDGEYVIRASSVDKFGEGFLDSINAGMLPGFKDGGKASFAEMTKKGQADFDRAQYVAKSQAASKANIAKKGKAFSEMFKSLIFDASSPEMAALSALPFGLGKVSKPIKGFMSRIKPEGVKDGIGEGLLRLIFGQQKGIYNSGQDIYTPLLAKKFPKTNTNIAVRIKQEDLMSIINSKDKRYKSLFETGTSNVEDTPDLRAFAEEKLFGLPKDVDPAMRPVYGYLYNFEKNLSKKKPFADSLFEKLTGKPGTFASRGKAKQNFASGIASLQNKDVLKYGDIAMILNKGKVGGRTTFTYGDSYAAANKKFATPARLGTRNPQEIANAKTSLSQKFFEAQIQGGFSLDEVKKIIVSEPQLIPQLQAALAAQKLRIPVKMPRLTMSQRLSSRFANGGMVKISKAEPAPRQMSMGGMMKPKYFINGDLARGSDIVPAMLTPGEFVMTKSATDNFGVDKLRAINEGTYSGDSVYNYNLSVSMSGSNLSPEDVARTVMAQIKQVDSQRLRGNAF